MHRLREQLFNTGREGSRKNCGDVNLLLDKGGVIKKKFRLLKGECFLVCITGKHL